MHPAFIIGLLFNAIGLGGMNAAVFKWIPEVSPF